MERRFLPYALDITDTTFTSESHYIALVMELLRSRHAQYVSFRGCTTTCSQWLRQETFMYLRLHLPGGCTDDNQVPGATVESDSKEVKAFAARLVNEWLLPCRVCCFRCWFGIRMTFATPRVSDWARRGMAECIQHVMLRLWIVCLLRRCKS
jgi:hypothetical protein